MRGCEEESENAEGKTANEAKGGEPRRGRSGVGEGPAAVDPSLRGRR